MVFAMVAEAPAGRRYRMHAHFAAEVNFHPSITILGRRGCVPGLPYMVTVTPFIAHRAAMNTPTYNLDEFDLDL